MASTCMKNTRSIIKYSKNVWDTHNIELIYKDLRNTYILKEYIPMTEIPPPFCSRCKSSVTSKCEIDHSQIISNDISIKDNAIFGINCPVFGYMSKVFSKGDGKLYDYVHCNTKKDFAGGAWQKERFNSSE